MTDIMSLTSPSSIFRTSNLVNKFYKLNKTPMAHKAQSVLGGCTLFTSILGYCVVDLYR